MNARIFDKIKHLFVSDEVGTGKSFKNVPINQTQSQHTREEFRKSGDTSGFTYIREDQ